MHVAVVAAASIVNAIYRGMVLAELRRLGHQVDVDRDGEALDRGQLRDVDVVHVHRYSEQETRQAVGRLKEEGVAIVWDNDDELTGSPFKTKGAMRAQQEQARVTSMLEVADLVTTTSPYLADQYRRWGAAEAAVVENYIPANYAADDHAERARDDTVTIGWIGAGEHYHDLERLELRATFRRLLEMHPNVRFKTVGLKLGLPAERCHYTALVQYRDLASHAASYDIGIAPIVDIPFNRARSNVKLKEYAVMGVPWLASPIGPYAGLGERQGGRLVPDDRWYEELERLVVDHRARQKLAKRALKWGDSQRIHRNLRAWEAPLQRAVERAGSRMAATG
jgi:glycosyltransferase involved in cell wall biosynthesis